MATTVKDPRDLNNLLAEEGVDRCWCGCKYWENDQCIDCDMPFTKRFAPSTDNPALNDLRDVDIWPSLTGRDRVQTQLDYLEDGFGATARNDGIYQPWEIVKACAVLNRWVAVFGQGV